MEVSGETRVLRTDTPDAFEAAVAEAAEALRRGDVVALPTETVYGLAANAWNIEAVRRIFQLKERPPSNPVIVHVASLDLARQCVSDWPDAAARVAEAFWPGPLTLVLPRSARIPDVITAGGGTVGVRWPRHPFIQAVIRSCGFPLAAPSANRAGSLSPTDPRHVLAYFDGKIPLIVDGGPAQVGLESTVLDLTTDPPSILRPGMIDAEALQRVLGRSIAGTTPGDDRILKSPGRMLKHYAPRAKLLVRSWNTEEELREAVQKEGFAPERAWILAHERVPPSLFWGNVSVLPHDAEAYARALYAELHKSDASGAEVIVVESPPKEPEWEAIHDRLWRAAAGS